MRRSLAGMALVSFLLAGLSFPGCASTNNDFFGTPQAGRGGASGGSPPASGASGAANAGSGGGAGTSGGSSSTGTGGNTAGTSGTGGTAAGAGGTGGAGAPASGGIAGMAANAGFAEAPGAGGVDTAGTGDGGMLGEAGAGGAPEPGCSDDTGCTGDNEYCHKESCDAPSGECRPRRASCTGIDAAFDPVCGCDGMTYFTPCVAEHEGVNVALHGECERNVAATCTRAAGGASCVPARVRARCYRPRMNCDGNVTPTMGVCWVLPDPCPTEVKDQQYCGGTSGGPACVGLCEILDREDALYRDSPDCP